MRPMIQVRGLAAAVLLASLLFLLLDDTHSFTIQQHTTQHWNSKVTSSTALHLQSPSSSSSEPQQPPSSSPHDKHKRKKNNHLVRSRLPHALPNGRGTFLGFRNTKDVPGLKSSAEALMPDGGLSPCVIRVLGVGGGGCNAVRCYCCCYSYFVGLYISFAFEHNVTYQYLTYTTCLHSPTVVCPSTVCLSLSLYSTHHHHLFS